VTFDQGLLQTVDPLFASEPRTLVESEQGIRAVAWQWLPPDAAPPQLATAEPTMTEAPTIAPNALQMIVFGDAMVTYAATGEPTFPEIYADMVEAATGRPVHIHTFGHESWHTSDALVAMRILEPGYPSDLLPDADIILVSIGANDGDPIRALPPGVCTTPITSSEIAWDCVAAYAPDFAADLHELIDEFSLYYGDKPRAIRITAPELNRFIGWDQAPSPTFAEDVFVNVAFAMQVVACETAPSHGQLCTGIVELLNGPAGLDDPAPYLEPDRLNLNLAGRQRVAEAVFGSGLMELDASISCIESSVQQCPTPYWRNR
jgi:lysophospholipase L1-like esterase